MRTLLPVLAVAAAALALPAAASAATVTSHIERHAEFRNTHVRFTAAAGERNTLTIDDTIDGIVFRDAANPVTARGDCVRLAANAARCPEGEDAPVVRLGDGDDRAGVRARVVVLGEAGADELTGGREDDQFDGGAGDDRLSGGRGADTLTGGTGRDVVLAGSGDDTLVDGETDATAAPDLYRGGNSADHRAYSDRGDVIDYSSRRHALRIDLGHGRSNTGDRILGLESIIGGRGDDVLKGDGDDNQLEGGRGDDVLRSRGGQDILLGGPGDDLAAGGDAHDVVWGQGGTDRLLGERGDDLLEARDGGAERVDCGRGSDDDVVGDRGDTLDASCERATEQTFSHVLSVVTRPRISGSTATFRVACLQDGPGACSGEIALSGLDGTPYGTGPFANLPDDPETFSDVAVPLTPAGTAALQAGATVQVAYGRHGGYRAFMRAG